MLLHVPLLQSINGLSALILHICYILMLLHVPILQSIDGLSALILLQIHICYILMLLHVPINITILQSIKWSIRSNTGVVFVQASNVT